MKLYHITNSEYLSSILTSGLIAGINKVARFDTEEDTDHIYLTSDWDYIMSADFAFDRKLEYTLLEVDVTEIQDQLVVDENYKFEDFPDVSWYYNGTISPDKLKVLGTIKFSNPYNPILESRED